MNLLDDFIPTKSFVVEQKINKKYVKKRRRIERSTKKHELSPLKIKSRKKHK